MDFSALLHFVNYHFTLFILFPSMILIGSYLTLRLRCLQILQLPRSFACLTKKNNDQEGSISHFEAVSAVLAGNFGTGNISGMAVALASGGPGALVWMWIMTFFGSIIQYTSCVLGVLYRQKKGCEFVGGPMYYLQEGLGYRKIAALFALCALFGAVCVGNFAQIHSIVLPMKQLGLNPFYCSLLIAFLVAFVLLGGIQRLARLASLIVPFKAALYLGSALLILLFHLDQLLPALKLMFKEAFAFESAMGGAIGATVFKAMTTGFDRGTFATDAGTGIVPILQSSARSKHPVLDGIATLAAPFMVMIVCTATGLVLIVTGVWQDPQWQSTNMVMQAFNIGLAAPIGGYIVMFALLLFAYTTILAWAYCGEKASEFLAGAAAPFWFRIAYILLIPVGSLMDVSTIWTLADIAISLMVLINLTGVLGLSSLVVEQTRNFHRSNAQNALPQRA